MRPVDRAGKPTAPSETPFDSASRLAARRLAQGERVLPQTPLVGGSCGVGAAPCWTPFVGVESAALENVCGREGCGSAFMKSVETALERRRGKLARSLLFSFKM